MNKLVLQNPVLYFDDNHHPVCSAQFMHTTKSTFLLDTGFSLGFAFAEELQKTLDFKNGYLVSMLLGNGRITKGIVFAIELYTKTEGEEILCGKTSAVFMKRTGDPLIGVEALRLWSPLSLDWNTNSITSKYCTLRQY